MRHSTPSVKGQSQTGPMGAWYLAGAGEVTRQTDSEIPAVEHEGVVRSALIVGARGAGEQAGALRAALPELGAV